MWEGGSQFPGQRWPCVGSWVKSCPQGPRSTLHYCTTLRRWLGYGRGVATRLVSGCSSRLSRAPRLLCAGHSLALSDYLFRGVAMTFCQGSKAHHFSQRLKSMIHSNRGIPTTFESNGIFENLKCHSGRQWHIQEGVHLLREYFSQCNLAYILQAFNHVRCYWH